MKFRIGDKVLFLDYAYTGEVVGYYTATTGWDEVCEYIYRVTWLNLSIVSCPEYALKFADPFVGMLREAWDAEV